jgi:hypothetical protein
MSKEPEFTRYLKVFGLILILLAGCSTTTKDLRDDKNTITKTFEYEEDYQEIYRKILESGKRCNEAVLSKSASVNFDGKLFTELGYGELTYSITNYGFKNYYALIRIEKVETGSRMTVTSGNTADNTARIELVRIWAGGEYRCT